MTTSYIRCPGCRDNLVPMPGPTPTPHFTVPTCLNCRTFRRVLTVDLPLPDLADLALNARGREAAERLAARSRLNQQFVRATQ